MFRLYPKGVFNVSEPLTQGEPIPPELRAALHSERIGDVVNRTPVAVAVNAVNATVTAWVLSRAEPAWPGSSWR